MKILHLNTFDTGGAAIAAKRLHLALLEQGVESKMLFVKKASNAIEETFEVEARTFTLWDRLKVKTKALLKQPIGYWQQLNHHLKGQDSNMGLFSLPYSDFDLTLNEHIKWADVINLHWVPSMWDYNLFQKLNKPIVWTLHDMNVFTGGCHYTGNCIGFTTDCKNCPQLLGTRNSDLSHKVLSYKQKQTRQVSITYIALCDWMKNSLRSSLIYKNEDIFKIYNSLDTKIFKPINQTKARAALSVPLDRKIVLFVSERIDNQRKGGSLLPVIIQKLKEENIHFYSIGAPKVEEIDDNLFQLGIIQDEETMAKVYNIADVLIVPSTEDNLPNVMLEALCCGLPVVSFSNGGMNEIIKPGENGLLVKEQTSEAMIRAVEEYFLNSNKYDKVNISENAQSLFNASNQAKAYIEVYQELLK